MTQPLRLTSKIIPAAVGLLTILLVNYSQLALAGWKGTMNSTGYGQASVNVRAADTSLLKTKTVTTINMDSPSAAMAPVDGYATNAFLPPDASPATVARVLGLPGYIWQANTVGSDGDSTDDAELESRVRITAADCASLEMTSSAVIAPDDKSGTITVNAKATAGTALWVRGIEFVGDRSLLPNDDPATDVNETIEYLKTNVNSSLKWDVLLVGPFDLNVANCNALVIPFTVETTTEHLYFITDGVAKSLPLVIECPNDIVVDCEQTVTYPETVLVGGCGNITVSFNPPAPIGGSFPAGSFPVGATPITVTATDKDGNTTNCTFNVIVTDTTPPAVSLTPFTIPCDSTATVLVPVPAPGPTTVITDNCGGPVTVTPNQPQVYNGTGSVTWTFTDAAGNTTNVVQPVVTAALTFTGFYAPIGTVSNSCTLPSVVVVTRGSVAPIKFDMFCGSTRIITGTPPTVTIQPVSTSDCTLTGTPLTVIAEYQNDWHYNWDTTGWPKATYKVSVNLPDGITKPYVFIKIK